MLRKIIILSWAAVFCVRACGQPPLKQAVHHPHLHLKGAAYTNVTASSAAAAAGTQVSAYSSAPASILSSGAVVASSSSGSSSLTLISTSSAVSPASISTSITAAASSSSLSAYSSSAAAAPVSSSSSTESASSAAPSSTTSSPSPTPSSSTTPAHSSSAAPVSGGTKPKALPYNDGISYSASFTQYGAGDTYGSGNCNTNTVACGFFSPKVFQAAASQNLFGVGPGAGAGPACGTCWRLTPQTDSTGKPLVGAQETIVQVNNLCPIAGNAMCSQTSLGETNSLGARVHFDLCIDDGANTHFFNSSGTALGKGTATAVDCNLLAQK